MDLKQDIKNALLIKRLSVIKPAKKFIKHDYLVPGGPYDEQWDWDGFFIGMSLTSEPNSMKILLKYWCLNYLENINNNGFTPGLITPNGIDKRLKHIKPFLAQGIYFYSKFSNDYKWIKPYWSKLKKSVLYHEKKDLDTKTGLNCWHDSMESGVDNNVALLNYPNRGVIAVDLNTFLYREYKAMTLIAKKLKLKEEKYFKKRADSIKKLILKNLWGPEDKSFYNIEKKSRKFIKKITYSNFLPLWSKLLDHKRGQKMIKKYLLNPQHMKAKYGIRSLSRQDPKYNQKNIIKPHSNWQGPVWPIANYIYMHILLNYGFKKQALWLAETISQLCLDDIKKTGGMHENYNSETGQPLAAPDFVSWNILVGQMIEECENNNNPFKI